MAEERGPRPPLVCRWSLLLASRFVPQRARPEWRARWNSGLRNWWVLEERGEVPGAVAAEAARLCRDVFLSALRLRFRNFHFRHWMRGPGFVLAGAAAALALLALATGGLPVTRTLIAMALAPPHALPQVGGRGDMLFAYTFPIVYALATGVVLVAIGRLSLHRYGWRYWSFLVLKTIAVMLIVPLLWVEGGAALRAHIPSYPLRVVGAGLLFTVVFIAAFGCALVWSFADQRKRCPVCLRRLAMPVSIGSWASVFDPPTTELLCDEGHGSLCISDSETAEPERWTALDSSWHDLFEPAHAGERPPLTPPAGSPRA